MGVIVNTSPALVALTRDEGAGYDPTKAKVEGRVKIVPTPLSGVICCVFPVLAYEYIDVLPFDRPLITVPVSAVASHSVNSKVLLLM